MEKQAIDQSLPVACQVGAIPEEQRARWLEVGRQFYSVVEEVEELTDGYAFRVDPERLGLLGEYVMRDRLCCAFVRWEIIVEQANGPAWLRVRGPDGTKAFMTAAMEHTALLPLAVARRAGFAVHDRAELTPERVAALAAPVRSAQ